MMVVSGEPDEGTEDMHTTPKLVSAGSCADRLNLQEKA
jgi:hypothetical protein